MAGGDRHRRSLRFADEINAAHAYGAFAILNGIVVQRNFPNEDADDVVADAERVRAPMKRKNAKTKTSRYRGVCWH